MIVLLGIGFVAGIVTAISPCVLPVLPILLAGGASGRNPLRIVAGVVISFTVFTLFASWLLSQLGLPQDFLRNLAIVLLFVTAATLLVPRAALLIERPLAFFSRLRPTNVGGGFLLGATLGLVFVPCAGPVLATVTVVAAKNEVGVRAILLTLAYALGAAVPMLAIAFGGREAAASLRRHAQPVRLASGALIALVAFALVFHLDDHLAQLTPGYTTFIQNKVEDNATAKRELDKVRGGGDSPRRREEPVVGAPRLRDRTAASPRRRVDQQPAAHALATPRQGRPDRLLDVLVHQLPPHAASPEGVVRRLPLEGPRDHRGAHAGVRVRARHLQRARGRQATRHHVSGRAGQRLQDLGQLREPVLAGRVPDRPDRPRSPHPFRRGRIQRHRAVDSQAARRPGRDRTPGRPT